MALEEALSAGTRVRDVFVSDADPASVVTRARDAGARVHEVSEQVLRAVSDAVTPQGIVAVADLPECDLGDVDVSTGLIVVAEQLRDPANAGTLIRSAAACGCGGVVFTAGSVDPYAPKTLRAAAGAIFRTPLVTRVSLDDAVSHLRGAGFVIVGADAHARRSIYEIDLTRPTAIVVGNESWGLADTSALDVTVGIPMPGDVESLNAGVAGSVFLFEALRQRRIASRPR